MSFMHQKPNSDFDWFRLPEPRDEPPRKSKFRQAREPSAKVNSAALSDLVFHYDILGKGSIRDTLSLVTDDLESHNSLHDWDEGLFPDPVKRLAVFTKKELSRVNVEKTDYMVNFNLVPIREVKTTNGVNARLYRPSDINDASNQLFPTNTDVVGGSVRRLFFIC